MIFSDFNYEIVQQVWQKAIEVPGYDGEQARKDLCGKLIFRDAYNDTSSKYGWSINVVDTTLDAEDVNNLRPLQWRNNLTASDSMIIGNCNC